MYKTNLLFVVRTVLTVLLVYLAVGYLSTLYCHLGMPLYLSYGISELITSVILVYTLYKPKIYSKPQLKTISVPTLLLIILSVNLLVNLAGALLRAKLGLEVKGNEIGNEQATMTAKLLTLFATGCCAPILEEIIFRGRLAKGKELGNAKVSITIQALIFSVLHSNPEQIISAFIVGLILGTVAFKERSIRKTTLVHLLNNVTVILVSIFPQIKIMSVMTILLLLIAGKELGNGSNAHDHTTQPQTDAQLY